MSTRLIDDLMAYQSGKSQALLSRIQQGQLDISDILTIQSYLENPNTQRRVARQPVRCVFLHPQARLWYSLFLHFNVMIAKQEMAQGAPFRPFKIRMFVLKFVARKCTAQNRGLAMRTIRYGRLMEGWTQVRKV